MNVIIVVTLGQRLAWEEEAGHTFISQGEKNLPSIRSSSTDNFILIFPCRGPLSCSLTHEVSGGVESITSTFCEACDLDLTNQLITGWYTMGTWLHQTNQRNSQGFCENHWEKPFICFQKFDVDGSRCGHISTRRGQLVWECRPRRAKRWSMGILFEPLHQVASGAKLRIGLLSYDKASLGWISMTANQMRPNSLIIEKNYCKR